MWCCMQTHRCMNACSQASRKELLPGVFHCVMWGKLNCTEAKWTEIKCTVKPRNEYASCAKCQPRLCLAVSTREHLQQEHIQGGRVGGRRGALKLQTGGGEGEDTGPQKGALHPEKEEKIADCSASERPAHDLEAPMSSRAALSRPGTQCLSVQLLRGEDYLGCGSRGFGPWSLGSCCGPRGSQEAERVTAGEEGPKDKIPSQLPCPHSPLPSTEPHLSVLSVSHLQNAIKSDSICALNLG